MRFDLVEGDVDLSAADDRSHPYTCCCQICCDWWDSIRRRPTDEELDARWDCSNDVEGE
jgi:hypothetical protein